jgi:hypothetical protein
MLFQILGFFLAITRTYLAPILPHGILRHLDSGYPGGRGYVLESKRKICQAKNDMPDSLSQYLLHVKPLLSKEFW